jgi:hypothetical protein
VQASSGCRTASAGRSRKGNGATSSAPPAWPCPSPAVSEVEVGIDRVYGAHKRGAIHVFDDLAGYLEEKLTYSRKVDDRGEAIPGHAPLELVEGAVLAWSEPNAPAP